MPKRIGFLLCLLFSFGTVGGTAQVVRVGQGGPKPAAALGGSVTITVAPAFMSFDLVPKGVAASSSGVGVTTTWTGLTRLCRLNLYGYFPSSGAALTGGTPAVNIPTSAVLGQVPTTSSVSGGW